ncbi:hypothetical protein [Acidiphilium acidophilum]|uniref:hypothetical protein n=1 Tax=Acidiphilium acidophilum TaxID=76588 RepID=UPI002E8E79A5|nr:hypothetical protein [Acidiphilium acidophilum]
MDFEIVAAVQNTAQSEGRQLQAILDEERGALSGKRKQNKPPANIMAAYQASHRKFGTLYRKLAE